LFLAGQTGNDAPAQAGMGRFEAQTRRAFARMQMILEAAGGSLDNLVTMTVFITDIRFGDEFVRLRGEILKRDFSGQRADRREPPGQYRCAAGDPGCRGPGVALARQRVVDSLDAPLLSRHAGAL